MDPSSVSVYSDFGVAACISLAAAGSALGTGAAAMGAIGTWKKCFAQNKAAPFLLIVFIGFPLSQTIYGMAVDDGNLINAPQTRAMLK